MSSSSNSTQSKYQVDIFLILLKFTSNHIIFVQHLFAGTVAGTVSTIALYPLDLIKVRYQVHDGAGHAYKSIYGALKSIIRNEKIIGLYRVFNRSRLYDNIILFKSCRGQGIIPAVIASAGSWGGYFYFYENSKKRKLANSNRTPEGRNLPLNAFDHLSAGLESGCIMVMITNPIWLIKTRLQLQGIDQSSRHYKGAIGMVTERKKCIYFHHTTQHNILVLYRFRDDNYSRRGIFRVIQRIGAGFVINVSWGDSGIIHTIFVFIASFLFFSIIFIPLLYLNILQIV